MTGKVFDNSRDIYQDQAKILFDYYKAAAEKIVSEEMAVEQNIADLEDARKDAEKHLKKRHITAFVTSSVCLVFGIFLPLLFVGTIAAIIIGHKWYQSLQNTSKVMKTTKDLNDAEVKELDAQAEIIAGFEAQAKSCNEQQEQFSQFMDRIQEDISENTRNFAYIKYYEGALRDSVSHDTAIALSNVHMLDERRRQLLYVSPYLASYAKLPPSPQMNPEILQDVRIDLEQQVAENISRIDELKEGKATA